MRPIYDVTYIYFLKLCLSRCLYSHTVKYTTAMSEREV